MKLLRLLCILILAVGVALAPTAALACPITDDMETQLASGIEESHVPGMAVLAVDRNGSIVFEHTYGTCPSIDTPFLLGSLSKSFTAACILQLAEAGKLSLDESIRTYLPDARADVTVRQLLNQTGGLGEFERVSNYTCRKNCVGRHVYANVNYALLGKIVETVSGEPYAQYLEEHVLAPLGMTHTTAGYSPDLIQGYEDWFGFMIPAGPHYPEEDAWIAPAAGYISSSASDMGRYLAMYLRGGEGVLSEQSIETMFYDGVPVDAEIPYEYGMGWTLTQEPLSQPVLRHSGLVETGMTCMYILPEEGLGIILLADACDYLVGTDLLDRIGWNLVLSLTGDEPGQIAPGEYWTRHLGFDAVYVAVLAGSALPFFFLRRFLPGLRKHGRRRTLVGVIVLHFVVPGLLVCIPAFLGQPMWVVRDFVPDLYTVLWTSAGLLCACGIAKLSLMSRPEPPGNASQT